MNSNHFYSFWKSAMQFPLNGIDSSVTKLTSYNIPTYLLFGMKDTAVYFNPNFERWSKLLNTRNENNENNKFESKVYDNLGHAFFIEVPDVVSEDILQFIIRNKILSK